MFGFYHSLNCWSGAPYFSESFPHYKHTKYSCLSSHNIHALTGPYASRSLSIINIMSNDNYSILYKKKIVQYWVPVPRSERIKIASKEKIISIHKNQQI